MKTTNREAFLLHYLTKLPLSDCKYALEHFDTLDKAFEYLIIKNGPKGDK